MLKRILRTVCGFVAAAGLITQAYSQLTPPVRGVNGPVYAVAVDSQGNVYVGGEFTVAGDVYANNIAKWNPYTELWSALDDGNDGSLSGIVKAIAIDPNNNVYIGGSFNGPVSDNIIRWNPQSSTWSSLGGGVYNPQTSSGGTGTSSSVNAIQIIGTDIYVAGTFPKAGYPPPSSSIYVTNVAVWSTVNSTWSALGDPGMGLNSIIAWQGDIYVGGGPLKKWNGTAWEVMEGGPDNSIHGGVNAMIVAPSGNLMLGGNFHLGSSVPIGGGSDNVAEWDGTEFSLLPNSPMSAADIHAFANANQNVFVGGGFAPSYNINGNAYNPSNVVNLSFSTSIWDILGTTAHNGTKGIVYALATRLTTVTNYVDGTNLITTTTHVYAGGQFPSAGDGVCAQNIARWNSALNKWFPLYNNEAPAVAITSPTSPHLAAAPANISLTATASDGCHVAKVEFYQGSTLIGTDTEAPFSVQWNSVGSGNYTVTAVATDSEGATTTSSPISVTVMNLPTITTQPQSQTVSAGNPVTFTVAATGPGSLSYQWKFNNANIANATGTSYTIDHAKLSQAGNYTVVVTGPVGPTTSSTASLTVQSVAPTLNGSTYSGGNFQFTINGPYNDDVTVKATQDFVTWTTLGQVTMAAGTYSFTDPNASSYNYRFYNVKHGTAPSTDTLGFIKVTVPGRTSPTTGGYMLIANQLNNEAGSNTLSVIMPNVPDGTTIQKYDASLQSYSTPATFFGAPDNIWFPEDQTLNPGEGAFINNPTTNAFTVTLIGKVPIGQQNLTIYPGNNLVSSIVPQALELDQLAFPAVDGDVVYRFNPATQAYDNPSTFYVDPPNSFWDPVMPLHVGEAYFIDSAAPGNRTWSRNFSVAP